MINSDRGQRVCRILFDNGFQPNIITKKLIKRLNLKKNYQLKSYKSYK